MKIIKILSIIFLIILMTTLADLGYDQYFRRPLPQEYQQYSAVNYDALFEDGSIIGNKIEDGVITNSKIKGISWDKGKGGTLELGGDNNKSGILSLKDEANSEKVRLDKDGMIINDGKLVVKNADGNTTIDSYGLVSSTNFLTSNSASNSLNQNITAGDTVITGSQMTFTLERATNVLFLLSSNSWLVESAGNTGNGFIWLSIDGVEVSTPSRLIWFSANSIGKTFASHYLYKNMPAGTHTIKLVGHVDVYEGSPKINIYNYNLTYIQLGR